MTYQPEHLEVHTSDDRCTVYRLFGDGGFLSVPTAPEAAHETSFARELVGKCIQQLDLLEAARRKAANNPGLTELGKAEHIAGFRKHVEESLAVLQQQMADHLTALANFEARIFSPPKIEPSDAVTVAEDVELRTMLREMPPQARVELLQSIADTPRLMEAVLRSPIPISGVTEPVRQLWRAHVENTHAEYPAFAKAKAAAEWASQVLPQVQQGVGFTQRSLAEAAQDELKRRAA